MFQRVTKVETKITDSLLMKHSEPLSTRTKLKCQNQLSMQKNQFERQLNETQVELEKWQSEYRSSVDELDQVI